MQFSTKAATLLAILCMSGPALASMVNAVPIPVPEPAGVAARDPSWLSGITDTIEDVSKAGNAVGDAVSAGDSIVNAGKGLFDDIFGGGSSSQAPAPSQTPAPQ